ERRPNTVDDRAGYHPRDDSTVLATPPLRAESGVADAGAAALDVPGNLPDERRVAAGRDRHVVPPVRVAPGDESDPSVMLQAVGGGRSPGEIVGDRHAHCGTGVRDDDGEVVAGADRRRGDVRAGRRGAGEVTVEAIGSVYLDVVAARRGHRSRS